MEKSEILDNVNALPISERLKMVEEIISSIRKEKSLGAEASGTGILEFAGIIDNREASVMMDAVSESRKIDNDGR